MKGKLKIAFYTFGCKLNFSEASSISSSFFDCDNYEIVNIYDQADIYVLNSCSVTANAEKKCIELIRRVRRQNSNAFIVVMGCFAQLKPDSIKSQYNVNIVLDNQNKYDLFDIIEKYRTGKEPEINLFDKKEVDFISSYSGSDRTRVFFKIQDGCDYNCSYCIVPKARGRSRSDNIEKTIEKLNVLAENPVKELVLTGVNIGDFGKRHNESFFELLKEISKIDNIQRLRISSIEPDLLEDDIIKLVAESSKIMPHFHIPLQSGSDKVLKEMKRKYDTRLFANKVYKIKELMPLACIAVDVIAGFPTETEDDFKKTVRFLENLPVSYLHVFKFSKRENTIAADMENVCKPYDKKIRSNTLKELSQNKLMAFYELNKCKEYDVLFENKASNGFISGYTPNYLKVKTPYKENLVNQLKKVYLREISDDIKYECDIL